MKKILTIVGALVLFVVIALVVVSFLIEEPLRKYIVDQANRRLGQYRVGIKELDIHPFSLSANLKGVTFQDTTKPESITGEVGNFEADLELISLVKGRAIADLNVERPRLNLDLDALTVKHGKKERAAKSFHEVLKSIYPFEIDELRVSGGEVTVSGLEKMPSVTIDNIRFSARNIRNLQKSDAAYPSPFHLEASIFKQGTLTVDGEANIMLAPYPGFQANFVLDQFPLASLDSIAGRVMNVDIDKGTLRVEGRIEYAPGNKALRIDQAIVRDTRMDYYFTKVEKKAPREKKKMPLPQVTIQKLRIENSEFGYINKAAKPEYRAYISGVNATLTGFSTGLSLGPAKIDLHGNFMGTGETDVTGTFRPEKKGPDFDLNVAIRDTGMPAMNNLFRAYGNFDVKAGKFSFFSELNVKGSSVRGYVKPIFKDMKVYDERQDEEKDLFQQTYEMIVGGLSELLENPRESVATKAPVSGQLESPDISTWTAIVNLVQNAFFHSILPGFAENIKKS